MGAINVIVAGHGAVVLHGLASQLAGERDLTVVAVCEHWQEAVERISALRPDLVFLDVDTLEVDGFSVVEAIRECRMPLVVFVSASKTHALGAFEVRALDYLLKPFPPDRLHEVLARAREEINRRAHAEMARRLLGVLRAGAAAAEPPARMVVRTGRQVMFLALDEVVFAEACGNRAIVHTSKSEHKAHQTLRELESALGPGFMRIHRSTLVNLLQVQELRLVDGGEYDVVLKTCRRLRVARRYRRGLEERLRTLG